MSKSKKKTENTSSKTEQRQEKLALLVAEAKLHRAENKNLIQDLREDAGLASDLKKILCEDLVRVSEIPREILGPSASRQRYRELGHYSTSLVDFLFGMWAEFQRKAGIYPSLATKTVQRNIAKTSRAQDVAHYADEHVKPWDGAYDKLIRNKTRIRLLVGGDFHSRFCNPFALRVWNDRIKMGDLDGIRINGDLVDFPSLSTHRQLPGHFPLSLQEEIDWAVEKVLRPARKSMPKGDIKYILGNHDIRLVTAMADKSPLFASLRSNSFAEQFKLDELEIGLVCRANFLNPSARHKKNDIAQNWETILGADGRPLFTIVHGFLCGKDSARKHIARFMTHGTNGHLHDRQLISAGTMSTGVRHWFQTGCMAHPQAVAAGYIQGPVEFAAWSCGMLVVDIYPAHNFVTGEFIEVGSEIAVYRDKVWKIRQSERDQIQEMLEI